MNKVLLVGRVGVAPRTETFENGKILTRFSLATTEFFGKDNKQVTWHQINVWDSYGETIGKLITVGSQIAIEGRIQNSNYEKEGIKCVSSTIVTDKIELLDKKSDSTNEQTASNTTEPAKASPKVTAPAKAIVPPTVSEDDLPF